MRSWRMFAGWAAIAGTVCVLGGCDPSSEATVAAEQAEPKQTVAAPEPVQVANAVPIEDLEDVSFPEPVGLVGGAIDMRGKVVPRLVIEKWVANDSPDLEGKVVMIEFWATWCGPCRRAIPHLNQLTDRFGEHFQIISVTAEDAQRVQAFMQAQEMKSAVAIDSRSRLANALRIQGIPHAIICSSDGIVRWQGNPLALQDETVEQIVRANRALVAGQAG